MRVGRHDDTVVAAVTPKGERRRQALVEAAAELLREGGFDAVRHRSVASRAELPLASTTYYFASLSDLVSRAVEYSGNVELDVMRERVDKVSTRRRGAESTAELVVEVLLGPPDGQAEHAQVVSRFERSVACARNPELRTVQQKLNAELEEVMADLLRRCGRPVKPDQLRHVVAVVDGAAVNAVSEAHPDPRRYAREALFQYVDVIAPSVE
jgi:DNA-binding transcriptional regulator YbjK